MKATLEELKPLKARKQLDCYTGKNIIYKITNLVNHKIYIGITTRFRVRVKEHTDCTTNRTKSICYIHKAILKYGAENFTIEILDEVTDEKELNEKEVYYIDLFKSSTNGVGYNLTEGGGRGKATPENTLNRIAGSKKVKVAKYDLEGNFIEEFESVMEASRQTGIPDNDIHRCHKKKWSRNNFMFQKFTEVPLLKIEPYTSRRGDNFNVSGRVPHNRVACKLLNKITNELIEADSIEQLSILAGIHTTTIHRLKGNDKHKKWKYIVSQD